jgi:glycosyltransferase involved in cell wall biosynthesis
MKSHDRSQSDLANTERELVRGQLNVAITIGSLAMGGAERMALNLGRGLQQRGHRVTIVTVTQRSEWHGLLDQYGLAGLHVAGRATTHAYVHAWRVGRALRKSGFDAVVMVKYTGSERCTQAALNMLPDSVVAIPWIHADTDEAYHRAMLNSGAWNVAVGVGVGVTERARAFSAGRPVVHIPNGIDVPDPDLLASGRSLHDVPFHIAYVGRIEQAQKRVFLLPRILRRLRDLGVPVELSLVGDGPDRAELASRFREEGVLEGVRMHGALSHDEVYGVYAQAHATLMPSSSEAMPCVPIEAQLCGSVPVASFLPGVTDTIVKEGETGLLCPVGDVEAFAEAVQLLATNRALWQRMSCAGQVHASQFTIRAMAEAFEALIYQCQAGQYPLPHPRRKWLPVSPLAMSFRDALPLWLKRLGIRTRLSQLSGGSGIC